ncbi:MAG: Spy/CpxP family protein refolding chaperone, partial [Bacteriovoracaceae bacterium]|nr:Spy/CpxP family protein refolding chaperone [Bacteriovoracaceae bacterium]
SFFAAIISLSFSTSAHAGGKGRGGHFKEMFEKLNLSAEQKTQLENLRKGDKDKEGMKAKRQQKKELRKKMDEAFAGNASKEELTKLHTEMQSLRTEADNARFQRILSIREILTPEQRKKFQELKAEKWKKFKSHDEDEEDKE